MSEEWLGQNIPELTVLKNISPVELLFEENNRQPTMLIYHLKGQIHSMELSRFVIKHHVMWMIYLCEFSGDRWYFGYFRLTFRGRNVRGMCILTVQFMKLKGSERAVRW